MIPRKANAICTLSCVYLLKSSVLLECIELSVQTLEKQIHLGTPSIERNLMFSNKKIEARAIKTFFGNETITPYRKWYL